MRSMSEGMFPLTLTDSQKMKRSTTRWTRERKKKKISKVIAPHRTLIS